MIFGSKRDTSALFGERKVGCAVLKMWATISLSLVTNRRLL